MYCSSLRAHDVVVVPGEHGDAVPRLPVPDANSLNKIDLFRVFWKSPRNFRMDSFMNSSIYFKENPVMKLIIK